MRPLAPEIPLNLKGKGDLAELMVAVDLLRRGHKIAIPYGEDCDIGSLLLRAGEGAGHWSLDTLPPAHARPQRIVTSTPRKSWFSRSPERATYDSSHQLGDYRS